MSVKDVSHVWQVVFALMACMFTLSPTASAETPLLSANASLRGDVAKLHSFALSSNTPRCSQAPCEQRVPAIRLSIISPEHHATFVELSTLRGKTANAAIDPSEELAAPLMLRGRARLRHAGAGSTTRIETITATVYRRGGQVEVEIGVPRRPRKGRPLAGITLIRAPLGELRGASSVAAREKHASAYGFAHRTCGRELTSDTNSRFATQEAQRMPTAQAAYRPIYLATDFDSEYASAKRCASPAACNDRIVGLINQASLFYEEQFGIQLEVAQQFGPSSYTSSSSSSVLLSEFTNSNNATRGEIIHDGHNVGDNLIDVHQLFTGKMLDNFVIGLAFVETMCTNSLSGAADMLVSTLSDVIDPVTTAHELGHSLGAYHTNAGIMSASLHYPLPSAFSPVSEREISAHLTAHYGECRGGASQIYEQPSHSSPSSAPKTLELSIRRGTHNSYIMRTKLSALSAGCVVTLRAAERASHALKGEVLTSFEPMGLVTVKRASVAQTIKTRTAEGANIFIAADYSCPNGTSLESSHPVKISPKAGSASGARVSRRRWIRILSKSF